MSSLNLGPAGNTYDKFNSQNPITQLLMRGFKASFLQLYDRTSAADILELGCGEGYMLVLMQTWREARFFGLDVDRGVLAEAQARCPRARLAFIDGHHLAYSDAAFDLVVACEVLEHVHSPAQVLAEVRRVTRRYAIFSVPREPLWRVLNMLRGRYLRDWGNTPGHVNHWRSAGFVQLLKQQFRIVDVRQPLPWTMVLCEVPARTAAAE